MSAVPVCFSVAEHEIALADTPAKVKSLDDKLSVIQELFRKERRALGDQNELAAFRIRAQRRGGELLAATVRQGRPSKRLHDASFSLPDGISKHVSTRWQAMAGIAEKSLDEYLKAQNEKGEEVTCAGFIRYAEAARDGVHYSSESDEWYTPEDIINRVVLVLGEIDLDPCGNSKTKPNVPAKKHFTKADDGLTKKWTGKVYMNPPYGRELPAWVAKLKTEFVEHRVTEAIALVPSRTDTGWFRSLREFARCFIWGRLSFSGSKNGAPFPSMVVYLGNNPEAFTRAFEAVGDTYSWSRGDLSR